MIAQNNTPEPPESDGGSGGRNARTDGNMTVIRDGRLTARAIREGWYRVDRWPTRERKSKLLSRIKKRGEMTPIDRAMVTTYQLQDSNDDRSKGIGVKCVLAMEAQNIVAASKAVDKIVPDLHQVGGGIDFRVTAVQLLEQPEYVEWLRTRECDSEPSDIRTNGHAGNGKPLGDG
jgi:hypothetical protein